MQKPVVEKRYGGGANAVSAIGIGSDACVNDEVNENESENATETKGGNWNGCGDETVTESDYDHAYCETWTRWTEGGGMKEKACGRLDAWPWVPPSSASVSSSRQPSRPRRPGRSRRCGHRHRPRHPR